MFGITENIKGAEVQNNKMEAEGFSQSGLLFDANRNTYTK